jgi:hypothetical protein
MHEEVKQRTGEKQKVRQNAQRMRPMFLPQKEAGDCREGDEDDPAGGAQEWSGFPVIRTGGHSRTPF